ncbi:MAG: NAD(P)/FAD-dependent oxidoreductase [Actinobacteria bacterium]|nr:MAG: NAD(P)/FAD-dependent oxidoreductase [Actinomycetota bacterium]
MKAGAGSDEFRAQNDTVIRALTAFTRTAQWTPRVAILGAGPGGLNSAYKLQQAGIDTFTIYERQDGVGGVWRQNTYPGAACDVKTHFYSFSWEMKKDWRKPYANQPEILEYLEHVADKYGLRSHLQLNTVITSLEWNEGDATWSITAGDGRVFEADLVISALGLFNEARFPDIPGRANFKGTTFHSWKWNHDHDLTGERVAVIGTGASVGLSQGRRAVHRRADPSVREGSVRRQTSTVAHLVGNGAGRTDLPRRQDAHHANGGNERLRAQSGARSKASSVGDARLRDGV